MPAHSSVAKVIQGTAFHRLGNCSGVSDRDAASRRNADHRIHERIAAKAGEKRWLTGLMQVKLCLIMLSYSSLRFRTTAFPALEVTGFYV
jgi:hypothetical protein